MKDQPSLLALIKTLRSYNDLIHDNFDLPLAEATFMIAPTSDEPEFVLYRPNFQ